VSDYALDGGDDDLRRLMRISELSAKALRAALRRVGARQGWSAIECGCGPIGGLAVLAETVGSGGRVVGIDVNESAVRSARSAVSLLALDNVEIVTGDLHRLDPAVLGGPFDLAYTRCFLMHQSETAHALARLAELVRPGGWIVCQEPLRAPAPRSHPPLEALDDYWGLLHALLGRIGVPPYCVEELPRLAADMGLEVHGADGFFTSMSPDEGLGLHAGTLAAVRERAMHAGAATAGQIDELLAQLRDARHERYRWVSTPFFLDLALHKPSRAEGGTTDRVKPGT
jgi:SAM-dependent methyltransferase